MSSELPYPRGSWGEYSSEQRAGVQTRQVMEAFLLEPPAHVAVIQPEPKKNGVLTFSTLTQIFLFGYSLCQLEPNFGNRSREGASGPTGLNMNCLSPKDYLAMRGNQGPRGLNRYENTLWSC